MSERKFLKVLSKPGSAAALRENVSAAVRQSTLMVRPHIFEPIDYEAFVMKNRTIIQQDPQRELILYPMDDFTAVQLPKQLRTVKPVPNSVNQCLPQQNGDNKACIPLHVRECIDGFTRDWTAVSFKYEPYSGSWTELPKAPKLSEHMIDLSDQVYEIDDDYEQQLEDAVDAVNIAKEGYVLKGSEAGTDSLFSVATKSFKRRWMTLKQEVDGNCVLELHKDHKKLESKGAICLDCCNQVTRNSRRGKYAFELRMTETQKPYVFATENDADLEAWIDVISKAIQCKSETSSRKSVALSDGVSTPPSTPKYGTLRKQASRNPELLKYTKETEYSIAQQRKDSRVNVFSVFPDLQSRR
ncbi:dedicator of cytokinesis protein 9-like protein, partial [Leptotrombidium deliense]